MKRFASVASAVFVLLLTAPQAAADPAPGDGLPTTCDGLAAGDACDSAAAGSVGECVVGEADGGSPADGGLVCAAIPLTAGCDGKPIAASCLLDSAGDVGVCPGDGAACEPLSARGDSGGCAVGAPDASSAFAFLGLLVPLAMRRRRRS